MDNGTSSRARVVKRRQRRNEKMRASKFGQRKNKIAGTAGMTLGNFGGSTDENGFRFSEKPSKKKKQNRQHASEHARSKAKNKAKYSR